MKKYITAGCNILLCFCCLHLASLGPKSSHGTTHAVGQARSRWQCPYSCYFPRHPRNELGCRVAKSASDLAGCSSCPLQWRRGSSQATVLGPRQEAAAPAGSNSSLPMQTWGETLIEGSKWQNSPRHSKVPGLCSLPEYLHSKAKVNNKRITTRTFSLGLLSFYPTYSPLGCARCENLMIFMAHFNIFMSFFFGKKSHIWCKN